MSQRVSVLIIEKEGWTDIHGPVIASIGCVLNDGSCTLEETLKVADQALYRANQNGRNQVSCAERRNAKDRTNRAPGFLLIL